MPRLRRKHYLLTFARCMGDSWAFGEATCSGMHPIEWVAAQREVQGRAIRLVSWEEVTADDLARFAGLVRP